MLRWMRKRVWLVRLRRAVVRVRLRVVLRRGSLFHGSMGRVGVLGGRLMIRRVGSVGWPSGVHSADRQAMRSGLLSGLGAMSSRTGPDGNFLTRGTRFSKATWTAWRGVAVSRCKDCFSGRAGA